MTRKFSLGVFFVLFAASAFGQGTAKDQDAEKLRSERRAKLIERVRSDAAQLKLPENRALINAKIGAAIWKDDAEQGRKLFQTAIAELLAAQQLAEANKTPSHHFLDLLQSQNLRPQILNSIASADAEFALDALYKTRPAAVERALIGGTNGKINGYGPNNAHLAQNEINLEQRIIRSIADQKPERSIALLKDSIEKRLTGETFNMLQKLFAKEPATANELANDLLERLNGRSFMNEDQPNHELISLSNAILFDFARARGPEEKSITFQEPRVRALAEKVINLYLTRGAQIGYVPLEQLEPVAKRFSLASFEALKKVAPTSRWRGKGSIHAIEEEYHKLMGTNPSADVMVTEARKFSVETRRSIYQTAANKYSESGQYQNAIALLNDQFEGEALDNAVSSMNWYYVHHLIQKRQYDAAETLILEFNESNRNSGLISLAQSIYNANRDENRSRAVGILNRVRGFLPDRPETSNDMSQLFNLINAMAAIESGEAFRSFEPLIDQINQITEAWAIVNAFQGANLREGEYVIANGFNVGVYMDPTMIRTLANKEFDRTSSLIDGFSRRELRVLIRLSLIEGGF